MNKFNKNSFNIKDLHVSKAVFNKSSWWTRLLNKLRGVESKAEYIWTVRLTIDNPRVVSVGDLFMTISEAVYKVRGKIDNNIIAVSARPMDDHGLINPCVIIRNQKSK